MNTSSHARAVMLLISTLGTPVTLWAQSFGYLGDVGPAHWSELSPDWATCNYGEIQSPVNLRTSSRHEAKHSRKLSISYGETTGEIFNNGHTIEVETEGNNILMLNGVPYQLTQFHFHTPSEHRLDRRGYDMELHLVHSGSDGSNAVIAVFLKRGSNSGALAPIFAALPDTLNVHEPVDEPFNPERFLPKSRDHYRYEGSLTTPPCTEGVRWIIMSEAVRVADEDMAQFAERIRFNARYVQRTVKP
jgi:carbonic anhydrase